MPPLVISSSVLLHLQPLSHPFPQLFLLIPVDKPRFPLGAEPAKLTGLVRPRVPIPLVVPAAYLHFPTMGQLLPPRTDIAVRPLIIAKLRAVILAPHRLIPLFHFQPPIRNQRLLSLEANPASASTTLWLALVVSRLPSTALRNASASLSWPLT